MASLKAPGPRGPRTRKRLFLYLTDHSGFVRVLNIDSIESMMTESYLHPDRGPVVAGTRINTANRSYVVRETIPTIEAAAGFVNLPLHLRGGN